AGSDATISVNGIPHQAMHAVQRDQPAAELFYDQIYEWFPGRRFGHALVVGAGSGTDTAYALANKVESTDAVGTHPRILQLGARPVRPLQLLPAALAPREDRRDALRCF